MCLGCIPFEEKHSSEKLADWVDSVIDSCNIRQQVYRYIKLKFWIMLFSPDPWYSKWYSSKYEAYDGLSWHVMGWLCESCHTVGYKCEFFIISLTYILLFLSYFCPLMVTILGLYHGTEGDQYYYSILQGSCYCIPLQQQFFPYSPWCTKWGCIHINEYIIFKPLASI